ncbi:glycosyltransferase family 4 protein [Pararhodobacter sp. CCB-MM2]|uniref:glycosyltransferase family 4 protein n=1 Tax=Pararhodobacter sp. CCB-MM2 TaxID=1786003 RepID=UPI00082E838C|nr:glycosyltransferase family 4 protein [Pararhodobacter sp. CCB-MM2]
MPNVEQRPRVLLIAEAANPEWVSVPLIGWSLSQALLDVADVHLVTQIRNREALLRAGLVEGRDFTAIDSEALARPLYKIGDRLRGGAGKGWTIIQLANALAYPLFERLIWKKFSRSLKAGEWDIVHRITPLSPTISSSLAQKCARIGVPFILGPLNGGVPWPKSFDAERRREREWLSYVRSAYQALPGRRRTLRNAAAILTGSRHTASEIPKALHDRRVMLPENAVDPSRFTKRAATDGSQLRACFIGRMVPYKGPDMLIEAAAPLLREGRMHLDMIGDGPLLPELKALAEALQVTQAVTFHGWLEHRHVQDVAATCSVMALPSIREFGGGVVVEAMAMGLLPVIVDYAGPPELVTSDTAVKVPLASREGIVAGFRSALTDLAEAPDTATRMGTAARARVEQHLTWAAKAHQIRAVYDWVLGRKPKPILFPELENHS